MKPPRFFSLAVIILFSIIVLLPIGYMISAPLWGETPVQADSAGALFDSRHITLSLNSLGLAGGTTILSLIIGVPLAILISRTNLWGRRVFGIVYIIPILIPPYIHAIVWRHLNGFIKRFLSLDIHSLWGAIFVLTLAYFPFVTLLTQSGLKSVDRNMEESSLLYHGNWKTLKRITLPLVSPHIISGAIFVFIFTIVDFAVPDIFRVKVYPVEIFIQFSAFYDERAAAIYSLPLIAVTLILLILQKRHMKDRAYVQISGGISKAVRYNLGRLNTAAFGICLLIICLSVLIPVGVLLKVAGPFSSYIRVFSMSGEQILYSLVLASTGAVLAVCLAFSISYLIERAKAGLKTPLEFASFVPLAIPATALGIGLIKVWNRPVADIIYASPLIIVLGYIARFIPFVIIAVTSGMKQVGQRVEEAAFLTTGNWSKVMYRIIIPLTKHSLIAGFFIVFILSIGELGTTLLVIPPGRETVPIKIYNLMHYGADQMVAALCLILIAIILAFSGLFLIVHKSLNKQSA
ncbi:MAG TPA: iron ABC transporter permease [Nitrospirae bacterium]|nr:iron ABC transporter permease [Nitrospirota bacterium]